MRQLLLLPGDGIGPEVCNSARQVAEWLVTNASLDISIEERAIGGASYDLCGEPLNAATERAACAADAVLLGAVGGPKWAHVDRIRRPEGGLLQLRRAMDVFANIRPAYCFPPLASASTLRPEVIAGLDLVIVRELVGGVYFGLPRGIEVLDDGSQRGIDTQVYTSTEIERVARVAFQLARDRGGRLTSVDKSNVMETGILWRRTVSKLHAENYQDVLLTHMYADNCAMQLIRDPRQFDVILTDNLFGDILSDAAAMVTGSLGMLPSAALGVRGRPGLYEPVHGSAPDIAGKGVANPLAAILSLEMALRSSLKRSDLANALKAAVAKALERGARTRDLGGDLSTAQMTSAVIDCLPGRVKIGQM